MRIDKSRVKRILVINLSNIGDAILTTPVIQSLRQEFPQARIAVLVGPRAFSVFKNDRRIDKRIVYDKNIRWKNKWALFNRLRQDKYDLVVDLRQTFFGLLLGARYRSSALWKAPKSLSHMKDRHLWKLKSLGLAVDESQGPSVQFSENDQNYVHQLLKKLQIKKKQILIAVAPGARNMTKRWLPQGYRQLVKHLISEYKAKLILIGDEQDRILVKEIIAGIEPKPIDLCGQTTIGQLAYLLTKCRLLISNDSAPMHLAWALQIPVVSIFGPTDYKKYAPGGAEDLVIRKDLECSPCEQSLCAEKTRQCMQTISVEEVFAACKKILDG